MFHMRAAVILATTAASLIVLGAPAGDAHGKIVCWKDAAGKVVGCGDKVPAEYLSNATKELDKHGNVRKTGESTKEFAERKEREQAQKQAQEEEKKRLAAQKRQDEALLNTFTNVKEIDLKRDRELRTLDNFITQQNAALKVANERLGEVRKRVEVFTKSNRPVPPLVKDDLASAEREKARVESEIAENQKNKANITVKYAEYRARFVELKGGPPAATAPVSASPAAPPKAGSGK